MEAIRIHGHESIVGALWLGWVFQSCQPGQQQLSRHNPVLGCAGWGWGVQCQTFVLCLPPLHWMWCMPWLLPSMHIFSFSTHPPCNMLWDAGCLEWCLPQSCYRTPKVITGLGGLGLARGEKEPVETNMQCCLFTTKPPTMALCHGILMSAPFGLVGLADGGYKNTWT